jgi:uncharacterized protein
MSVRFAGYAAVFDRPDRGGDIIRKGAFAEAVAGLPLYLNHDPRQRIGTVSVLGEDAKGLRVIAESARAPVQIGQGLSFGYRVKGACRSACGQYRELTQLDLIEISLVACPMQPLARVIATEACDPKKETENGL